MPEYAHKQAFNDRYQYQEKAIRRLRLAMKVLILGGLVLTILLANMLFSPAIYLAGLGAIALGARALKGKIESIETELSTLKSYPAAVMLEQKLPSLKNYNPFGMMDMNAINGVHIPAIWKEASGSDLVECAYRGVPLCFSNVKLVSFVEDKEGEARPETAFFGQVFALNMKKSINGKVWIGRFMDDETPILTRAAYEKRIGGAVTNVAALESQSIFASNTSAAAELLTDEYAGKLRQAFDRGDGRLFLCFDGDTLFGAKGSGRGLFENGDGHDWETMANSGHRRLDSFLELIDCLTDDPALFDRVRSD